MTRGVWMPDENADSLYTLEVVLLSGPFVCRCLTSPTLLRFHVPLIEPDVQVSCIRLSDRGSRLGPRDDAAAPGETDQAQGLVQVLDGELGPSPARLLVFPTQPLTQPLAGVAIHGLVHAADRA